MAVQVSTTRCTWPSKAPPLLLVLPGPPSALPHSELGEGFTWVGARRPPNSFLPLWRCSVRQRDLQAILRQPMPSAGGSHIDSAVLWFSDTSPAPCPPYFTLLVSCPYHPRPIHLTSAPSTSSLPYSFHPCPVYLTSALSTSPLPCPPHSCPIHFTSTPSYLTRTPSPGPHFT